ncbi:endonuclease domain-containing protein [Gryllotalpicola protaetiae]|uniref:DUF559 domain-containing protein n=1 Tax=Gryllotalpicola protaetiae TaxID=2419771 RepID=A0A387BTC6_9MICO|nr:DUF559 domain-containing protein [Gryllotalpicola protaetiae]AYG04197.1 DUF559 domain-containing protein [Gryllotalpicola protaetiae]
MTPTQYLDLNAGFGTRGKLRDLGWTDPQLRRFVASGQLIAIGRHVVARRAANPELLRAVRLGSRLACVSAALHRGLWAIDDEKFHVAPRALNSHAAPDEVTPPAVLHWTRHPVDPVGDLFALESVVNMLMHVAKCQPVEYAVAVFDSAVRQGQIHIDELRALAKVYGGRFRRVVALTSTQSDSGIESIARVRLFWAGIATREQVKIDGHPVDLLIGDRLIIQLDGKQHLTDPVQLARDRAQDRRLKRMGYTVLRYGYAEVIFAWADVAEEIGRTIAQRLHLW